MSLRATSAYSETARLTLIDGYRLINYINRVHNYRFVRPTDRDDFLINHKCIFLDVFDLVHIDNIRPMYF